MRRHGEISITSLQLKLIQLIILYKVVQSLQVQWTKEKAWSDGGLGKGGYQASAS